MKFSVVTPSYNQGLFIGRMIDSVRSEGEGVDIEHIILDNCSTDETRDELARYKQDPGAVKLQLYVEPDKGQTSAINKGFGLSVGEIVCWLNTDEYYLPGALKAVAEIFEDHPDVDVVFGNCVYVDSQGSLLREKREFFFSQSMLLYYGCYLPSCSTFVRRRVIDAGVLLDERFKVTMDFDWYVRIAKVGFRFEHVKRMLAAFTWHDSNISSNYVERRKFERSLVQLENSGIKGPTGVRKFMFECIRYAWVCHRAGRRLTARLIG